MLLCGCDKTTPALIMGATSMGLPFIYMPAGPMLRGNWHGEPLGSGTDRWKYWAELRAGKITEDDWREVEEGIARSYGHCMVMGTASTMTSAVEALGLTLPGAASIPAADSAHPRMATATGRRIVEMVWEDLRPSMMLTPQAFDNAIKVVHALSGSTNALIHIVAMAGRAGVKLDWDHFDRLAQHVPVLANLRPAGEYLMEDFYYAGGLRALLKEIEPLLDTKCATVNGKTLGENIAQAKIHNTDVIRTREKALSQTGGLAVLRGNLAPDGVVIKPSACEPRLLRHTGRALVFDDYPSLKKAVDDPDLDVTGDDILVLRYAGPQGGPGMPEWGMLPIPTKLLKQGVKDMLRLSVARMSGTSYGGCLLHCAPEAYVCGPLALVKTGDRITVDVPARRIHLEVSDDGRGLDRDRIGLDRREPEREIHLGRARRERHCVGQPPDGTFGHGLGERGAGSPRTKASIAWATSIESELHNNRCAVRWCHRRDALHGIDSTDHARDRCFAAGGQRGRADENQNKRGGPNLVRLHRPAP